MNKKKVLITTPIYYPSGNLHIGHAYTTTLTDFLSRFHKQQGSEVFFITGSDEHGQKIQEKADEANLHPLEYVTGIIKGFYKLWDALKVENDLFIRTTDPKHEKFVQEKFKILKEKGHIYKGKYEGNYCIPCEEMWTDGQIDNAGKLCPNCGRATEKQEEESYFLNFAPFQKYIKDALENKGILEPQHKAKELINNFIEDGLQDLSISRTSFTWGIPVPGDSKHVMYVWLDALLNYISAFEFDEAPFTADDIWRGEGEIIQLVGKEITRFHSIYWPIILEMLDYKNPKVYSHGWLLDENGEKMSKSKGNVVDPFEFIETYGRDALRWYLANGISFGGDGRISHELVKENINGVLVNKYSNLISRTMKMLNSYRDSIVPPKHNSEESTKLNNEILQLKDKYVLQVKKVDITNSTKTIIKMLDEINGYIDITEPWKSEGEKLDTTLNDLIHAILKVSILIAPLVVDGTKKVFQSLLGRDISTYEDFEKNLEGKKIEAIENLFMRIK